MFLRVSVYAESGVRFSLLDGHRARDGGIRIRVVQHGRAVERRLGTMESRRDVRTYTLRRRSQRRGRLCPCVLEFPGAYTDAYRHIRSILHNVGPTPPASFQRCAAIAVI